MKTKSKLGLIVVVSFSFGLGLGGFGGFILNDLVSRENPAVVEQIRQEFETQNQLEELFARQRAEREERESNE